MAIARMSAQPQGMSVSRAAAVKSKMHNWSSNPAVATQRPLWLKATAPIGMIVLGQLP